MAAEKPVMDLTTTGINSTTLFNDLMCRRDTVLERQRFFTNIATTETQISLIYSYLVTYHKQGRWGATRDIAERHLPTVLSRQRMFMELSSDLQCLYIRHLWEYISQPEKRSGGGGAVKYFLPEELAVKAVLVPEFIASMVNDTQLRYLITTNTKNWFVWWEEGIKARFARITWPILRLMMEGEQMINNSFNNSNNNLIKDELEEKDDQSAKPLQQAPVRFRQ